MIRLDDGRFALDEINAAASQMLGTPSEDLACELGLEAVLPADEAIRMAEHFAACMDGRGTVEFELVLSSGDRGRATRTILYPLADAPDRPIRRLFATCLDVTEEHRLKTELERSSAHLSAAMDALGGAHWYYDVLGQTFDLSPSFSSLLDTGYAPTMPLHDWLGHVHPDDRNDTCFADLLAGRIERGGAEFRLQAKDGDVRWLRCRRQAIKHGSEVVGVAGAVIDITQEKRKEALLCLQASTDPLTGLANRRQLEEVLASGQTNEAARNLPVSMLMIDVDYFKLYNDTYGHQAGDIVLRRLARCISELVVPIGGLAARYGGEEFAAVLPGLDTVAAARLADVLLKRIGAMGERHSGDPSGKLSVSIGVAGTRGRAISPEQMIGLADVALYRAKRDGRGRYRVAVGSEIGAFLSSSAA